MSRRAARRKPRRRGRRAAAPAPAAPTGAASPGVANRQALAALGLGLLAAAVYLPAFSAGFVWDDEVFTDAAAVREWSGLWKIWFAFSPRAIPNEGHYWPLVHTTFWLEHKLWGFAPAGYHAVNVLLHAANTVLLWRLAGRLDIPGAWAIAAVFAVHPLHVESVAWVIERKDLLSALFYLAAVSVWLRFSESGGRKHYALALVLFVLGLLCKSIVVTLPAALLICHWWKRGRVDGVDLLRLAPFFAVGIAIAAADTAFYAAREPLDLGYTVVERVLIAAHALWFYVEKLLWPAGLAVIYPHWAVDAADPLAWGRLAAVIALGAALWVLRRRIGRGPFAGTAFFAVTLSPVLGFIDYGYMQFSFVADRYQYLAGIGPIAVLTGAAAYAARRLPERPRMAAAGLAAVALVVLGTLTFRQAEIYRDEVTFFGHIVAHNPAARGAQGNLGKALLDAGRLKEALSVFDAALERTPDDVDALANAGVALIRTGRFDEAEELLRRGLALDPRHRIVLQNLAESLRKRGRFEEALGYYRAAIDADPGNALAYAGMGDALVRLERYGEALKNLDRALALGLTRDTVRTLREVALERLDAKTRRAEPAAPSPTFGGR